jgi:predicted PurR-regulated permease PerM
MSGTPTIDQMNEVIARLDGWESRLQGKGQHSKTPLWYKPSAGYAAWDLSAMKYHTSWDWLKPVVEKINKLATSGDAINGITENIIFSFSIFAPMKDTHAAVYQFIQWYNQNKNQ